MLGRRTKHSRRTSVELVFHPEQQALVQEQGEAGAARVVQAQSGDEGGNAEEISLAALMMLSGTAAEQALEVVMNEEMVKGVEDGPSGMKKEAMGEATAAKGENLSGEIGGEFLGVMEDVSMAEVVSGVGQWNDRGGLGQRPREGEMGEASGVGGVAPQSEVGAEMWAMIEMERLQEALVAERLRAKNAEKEVAFLLGLTEKARQDGAQTKSRRLQGVLGKERARV